MKIHYFHLKNTFLWLKKINHQLLSFHFQLKKTNLVLNIGLNELNMVYN